MLIDGKAIAAEILEGLKQRVATLSFIPKLAVILVGEDPASEAYVNQKQLKAENINAEVEVIQYPIETTTETILDKIRSLNTDSTIHGIIVQRPLPSHINTQTLQEAIIESKDIDGFKPTSPFYVPVVLATMRILGEIMMMLVVRSEKLDEEVGSENPTSDFDNPASHLKPPTSNQDITLWLKTKHIVLLGKGSTAGKPLMDYFNEMGISFQLIDSKTENPSDITKKADIIISSVGQRNIITPDMIKSGVSLIGIGIHRGEDDKLHGDYDEDRIKDIAAFYTPTPGGVGPVNVAMLLENLVTAAEHVK